ncbi:MAG: TetR/AcrR family transcriptional regulator [Parasphingorhabdus sp.]|uniref:TetR/AcrR family transcriptional regulator n=1 Tax=Parasphingorhabdus sp. TaxID=2709688 RepID=UPI0032645962
MTNELKIANGALMKDRQDILAPAIKRGRPFGSSSKNTRARLIKAAEEHFNARAYSDVSMAKVAESAGITGAAIYNYFDSKDDLLKATLSNRIQIYNQTIRDAVSGSGSWQDQFNRLLEAVTPLQGGPSGFPMIGNVVINRLQEEPEKFQEIRDLRDESAQVFRSLVAAAVDCGDLPQDTDVVIAGDLMMAITAGAVNTVSFYHPALDSMAPIIDSVKALLGTKG